jgi:hypothetical protein
MTDRNGTHPDTYCEENVGEPIKISRADISKFEGE